MNVWSLHFQRVFIDLHVFKRKYSKLILEMTFLDFRLTGHLENCTEFFEELLKVDFLFN